MKALIKTLKKTFPIDKFFFHRSYSQEGEDMIYRSCFENRKHYKGFYIDVGAHHPYRFSNTVHFYQNGWRGINIEALIFIHTNFTGVTILFTFGFIEQLILSYGHS
ncbi:hypothetical protein [Pedobacter cryoconitis]|nr:hypothetical protein [Pedobacter cryoconitis]